MHMSKSMCGFVNDWLVSGRGVQHTSYAQSPPATPPLHRAKSTADADTAANVTIERL
jgi:hypothetical protein